MKPWYRIALYLFTLPIDIVGWLLFLLVHAAWGSRGGVLWREGVMIVWLARDSWPARTWYAKWGGTTIGHAIVLNELYMGDATIVAHEMVHVEQNEATGLLGGLVALAVLAWVPWWVALLVWGTMPALAYLLAGCAAVLRGEDWYMGSHNEEAARAVQRP